MMRETRRGMSGRAGDATALTLVALLATVGPCCSTAFAVDLLGVVVPVGGPLFGTEVVGLDGLGRTNGADGLTGVGSTITLNGLQGQGPSEAALAAVGQRIWRNECRGTVDGLTSWNKGEGFASLGIGHFLWYPHAGADRFQESFPQMLAYMQQRGVTLPPWLAASRYCPWKTKEEFDGAHDDPRMVELRNLLAQTVPVQTEFIAKRLEAALPAMLAQLPSPSEQAAVRDRFYALYGTEGGLYALMDYVNFKGEGTNPAERYNGQGWGLLQVLQGMQGQPRGAAALAAFSDSARRTLERRVQNAPADRQERERGWLAGWTKRCESYRG